MAENETKENWILLLSQYIDGHWLEFGRLIGNFVSENAARFKAEDILKKVMARKDVKHFSSDDGVYIPRKEHPQVCFHMADPLGTVMLNMSDGPINIRIRNEKTHLKEKYQARMRRF